VHRWVIALLSRLGCSSHVRRRAVWRIRARPILRRTPGSWHCIHGSTDPWIHGYGVFVASLRGDSQLSGETRSCLSQTGAGFLLTLQTPPTFDSLRRTGGGGEVGGRGSTHELLGRGAQKDHPVLSTGKHFGTTMLVALRLVFVSHSLFCAPLTSCRGDGQTGARRAGR